MSARDVLPDWTDDDEARLRADLERSGLDPDAPPPDATLRRVARVYLDAGGNAHRSHPKAAPAPATRPALDTEGRDRDGN